MYEMLTDFSGSAMNTCLSENSHQAVGFHPQIFNQLQMETAYQIEITVTEQPRQNQWWWRMSFCSGGGYLPEGVEPCSLWHRIFPWFVLDDSIVVRCFPVHHRQSKGARLLFFSHPGHKTKSNSLGLKVSWWPLTPARTWKEVTQGKLTETCRPAVLRSKAASHLPGGGFYHDTKASSRGQWWQSASPAETLDSWWPAPSLPPEHRGDKQKTDIQTDGGVGEPFLKCCST